MFRLGKIIGISLLLLILIGGVSAADDANRTMTANPIDDVASEIQVENKTFDDIQKAVDSSQSKDIIELEGVYTGNGSKITVDKELTFVGKNEGATLDARNLSEIIYSSAPAITFKNIVFKNVNQTSPAIQTSGSLAIINSTFSNINNCELNCKGNLTIIDVSFDNCNDKTYSFKADSILLKNINILSMDYAHIIADNLIFDNCPLTNHHRYTMFEPINSTSRSNITLRNTRFLDSEVIIRYFHNITIENNKFSESYVDIDYSYDISNGAISKWKDNAFDKSHVEISVSYSTAIIENCNFTNYINDGYDGALQIHSKKSTIRNCRFVNNSAAVDGGAIISSGEGLIELCEFISNSAENRGGAIYIAGNYTIRNNIFKNNNANLEGGAIYITTQNPTIINNTFTNNTAWDGSCISTYSPTTTGTVIENILQNNHASTGIDIAGFYKFVFTKTGKYDGECSLTVKVIDTTTNKTVQLKNLKYATLEVYQQEEFNTVGDTYSPTKAKDGSLVFNIANAYCYKYAKRDFSLNATSTFTATFKFGSHGKIFKITIEKPRIKFKATSLSLTAKSSDQADLCFYNPGKERFDTRYVTTLVKIYKGNKQVYTSHETLPTIYGYKFTPGTYKIVATAKSQLYLPHKFSQTLTLKVNKMKTKVTAPKVTAKYKKSKYFTVTVKQLNKSPVTKAVKVKVKIGKKTYNLKTNAKGILKINTKSLKIGKYAVTITSGDSNYQINGKSAIVIKR